MPRQTPRPCRGVCSAAQQRTGSHGCTALAHAGRASREFRSIGTLLGKHRGRVVRRRPGLVEKHPNGRDVRNARAREKARSSGGPAAEEFSSCSIEWHHGFDAWKKGSVTASPKNKESLR